MSIDMLRTVVARALSARHRHVDFTWHGGEPLLLGRAFYSEALKLEGEFRRDGQAVENAVQTNGTLLDDRWCEFFAENQFHVGVSVDGPEDIHDLTRRTAGNRPSFEATCRGVRLLQKHTVPHGVLTVVSEQTLLRDPADYISFLLELGVKDFSFLPVRPQNRITTGKGSRPANGRLAAYTRFMQRVFDVWLELDDPSINVRELSSIVSGLAGAKPAVCTLAGSCIGRYFHIEPNGDTYHCDKYLSDPTYRVGNVRQQTFAEIRNGEKLQRLIAQENAKLEKLRACPSYAICHGGCPHDRYIAEKYVPDYDGSCCGMHPLIEHVAGRIEHTLDAPVAMS